MCNAYSIKDCNVNFKVTANQLEEISATYTLYQNITPIHLGVNISALRQLIYHPEMQEHLQQLAKESKDIMISIHHLAHRLENVLSRVKQLSIFAQW